jgi:hypothetical protein
MESAEALEEVSTVKEANSFLSSEIALFSKQISAVDQGIRIYFASLIGGTSIQIDTPVDDTKNAKIKIDGVDKTTFINDNQLNVSRTDFTRGLKIAHLMNTGGLRFNTEEYKDMTNAKRQNLVSGLYESYGLTGKEFKNLGPALNVIFNKATTGKDHGYGTDPIQGLSDRIAEVPEGTKEETTKARNAEIQAVRDDLGITSGTKAEEQRAVHEEPAFSRLFTALDEILDGADGGLDQLGAVLTQARRESLEMLTEHFIHMNEVQDLPIDIS